MYTWLHHYFCGVAKGTNGYITIVGGEIQVHMAA